MYCVLDYIEGMLRFRDARINIMLSLWFIWMLFIFFVFFFFCCGCCEVLREYSADLVASLYRLFSSCSTERRLRRNCARRGMSWDPRWRTEAESLSTSTRPKRGWRQIWLWATRSSTPCTWRSMSPLCACAHVFVCVCVHRVGQSYAAKSCIVDPIFNQTHAHYGLKFRSMQFIFSFSSSVISVCRFEAEIS